MKRQTIAITICTLHIFAQACSSSSGSGSSKKTPTTSNPVNPETGNPSVGTVTDDAGFFVEVLGDHRTLFNMHKDLGTFDAPCKINAGEVIDCYVEAEEATFWAHDFSLHYHVPSDMCTYVTVNPFYFVNQQTKLITTSQEVYFGSNGQIGVDSNRDGTIDSPLGCYTHEGEATCCVGEFVETVYKWDSLANAYQDPATTQVDRKIDKCLAGPAMKTQTLNAFGEPNASVLYVEGKGISDEYKISATLGHTSPSWTVNYFNPVQHSNGPPTAFYEDIAAGSATLMVGNPYYTVTCYDSAWENVAEVRIQLREWNTKSAYNNRTSAPTNHDETGMESSPFGTKPKNDFMDWYDYESANIIHPALPYSD